MRIKSLLIAIFISAFLFNCNTDSGDYYTPTSESEFEYKVDEFADLKNENKDNIREYEENESKLYLRINKLREMCKYRNKKIS